jgi:hypothetical protein
MVNVCHGGWGVSKQSLVVFHHLFRLETFFLRIGDNIGTNTIRAYDTTPPPGSKAVTTLSADVGTVTTVGANTGATGSILSTRRAAGRSSYADAAAGINSYSNAARRALKLPARLA